MSHTESTTDRSSSTWSHGSRLGENAMHSKQKCSGTPISVRDLELGPNYQQHVQNTGVFVRGDPGPFGLLCFGMTTCMLMFITTGWAEKLFLPTVTCYALFYGGAGQFVAGVLELIKGNTFGGTAFASYGAFWMGWWLLEYLMLTHPGTFPVAQTGKTLWCGLWAFLTFGFFIVTLNKNGCLMTIFSTLVITFSLLAGGMWSERSEQAAGYFGFFCGASAIYAAFAFLYKEELQLQLPGVRPVAFIQAGCGKAQAAGHAGGGAAANMRCSVSYDGDCALPPLAVHKAPGHMPTHMGKVTTLAVQHEGPNQV